MKNLNEILIEENTTFKRNFTYLENEFELNEKKLNQFERNYNEIKQLNEFLIEENTFKKSNDRDYDESYNNKKKFYNYNHNKSNDFEIHELKNEINYLRKKIDEKESGFYKYNNGNSKEKMLDKLLADSKSQNNDLVKELNILREELIENKKSTQIEKNNKMRNLIEENDELIKKNNKMRNLKEENENIINENSLLKDKILKLEDELDENLK